jgi:hypothetical protein
MLWDGSAMECRKEQFTEGTCIGGDAQRQNWRVVFIFKEVQRAVPGRRLEVSRFEGLRTDLATGRERHPGLQEVQEACCRRIGRQHFLNERSHTCSTA